MVIIAIPVAECSTGSFEMKPERAGFDMMTEIR
jgi:hypothetical protein